MSDSGFGNISSPARAAGKGGVVGNAQIVQITKLPDGLNNIAKTIRLEGEITKAKNDGSLRITTPSGDIEVKVRGSRQPQEGQRIEIEIPAGRPPRQASLRNAPQIADQSSRITTTPNAASTQPTPQQIERTTIAGTNRISPAPINAEAPRQNTAQTPIQTRAAPSQPIPPAIQETANQVNISAAQSQARPLSPEAVVRLISVPPAQAQTIATMFFQAQPAPLQNIITKADLAANLIAKNAQDQLGQILLKNIQLVPSQALIPKIQPQISTPVAQLLSLTPQSQNLAQPILTNNFFQTPALNTLTQPNSAAATLVPPVISQQASTVLLPIFNSQIISEQQTLPIESIKNILQAETRVSTANQIITPSAQNQISQPATLTALPVTFDPANPATLISQRTERIDVQVLRIIPPQLNLTAPIVPNNQPQIPVPAATQFTTPIISNNNASTITAQVTGFTSNNLPLVTLRLPGAPLPQSFVLQYSANNLQLGSQLQIMPKTPAGTTVAQQALPTLTANNPLLRGFQWPALEELYNGLMRINPQAAASLTRTLPNASNPAQIAPAAMMFIAAVKSGNMAGFFGDKKLDLIQRSGGSDILSRLTQAASNTSRTQAVEPASGGEWRAVPLPMFWEGEIHHITLYTRHESQQEQKKDQGGGQTRFVFDLSLSRMGDVQIDGLLRDKRLDLVIRTQSAFSEPMQQTMRQAYSGALGQTELSGELSFQGSTKNWVHVLEKSKQLGVHV